MNILISTFKFTAFFGDDGVLWVRFTNRVRPITTDGTTLVKIVTLKTASACGGSWFWQLNYAHFMSDLHRIRYLLDVKERENGAEYSSEIGICLRFMIRCANNL
ncbi:hypothetical protein [Escherichia coli]|uniref:hypothetical protein n=1 Tax=Escherichia coli TaxID=562 RepID=UPI003EB9A030